MQSLTRNGVLFCWKTKAKTPLEALTAALSV